MRRSLVWCAVAFIVAFAVVIGIRLENPALTVVVGVVCGVGASIPTGLLVVFLLQKKNGIRKAKVRPQAAHQPPVVVVTPPTAPQPHRPADWPEEYTLPVPAQRRFSVIGEEDEEEL